jgi:hypothetical protein
MWLPSQDVGVAAAGAGAAATAVAILPRAKQLLDMYISECPTEISGLGTVEAIGGRLTITGVYLLEQQVTSCETVLPAIVVAKFLGELARRGVDVSKVRLWWHSHADITSYFSSTDTNTIESFGSVPWWVSLVGNHAGDYQARIDVYPTDTIPVRLFTPARLVTAYDPEEVASVRREITRLVHPAPQKAKRVVTGSRSLRRRPAQPTAIFTGEK